MTYVPVTLVIAEKKSVAVDVSKALEGTFKSSQELSRGPGHRHHLGGRPPRRAGCAGALRRQVQALEDGRPAHPPAALRRRAARRGQVRQGAAGRDRQAHEARRHRADRERLRRRARGRADLRLRARRGRQEGRSGAARLVLVDDQGRDPPGLRAPAAGQRARAARGRGALALRGRLARGHERDARGHDPRPRGVRQHGGLARAACRRRRSRSWCGARRRSRPSSRRRTGSSTRPSSRPTSPPTAAATCAAPRRTSSPARTPTRSSARVRDGEGHVTSLSKRTQRSQPPLLYDLTALQREAASWHGFTARRTLSAAQGCYEKAVLTYPRTVEPLPLERHDPRAQGDRRPRRRALARSTRRAPPTCRACPSCRSAASSTTRRSRTTTRSSRRTRRRPASS